MKYTLTTPCDGCPFLLGSGFTFGSLTQHARGEFGCHKACKLDDETGNFEPLDKTPHCAGALIFLEKQNKPHQMMRICERLTGKDGRPMYDASKLNMNAPVGSKPSDYRPTRRKRKPK